MVKKIAIVDTSNPDDSKSRATSLRERLSEEHPSENAPSGLSWVVVECSPEDVTKHIDDYWLIWAHDSPRDDDLDLTVASAEDQERRHPNALPAIIVGYGGGFVRYAYPPDIPNREQIAVSKRMIRTHRMGGQDITNFHEKPGSTWNLVGFLRSVADSYPEVDESKLLPLLCGQDGISQRPSVAGIAHTAVSIIRILEGDMLDAVKGCASAKGRFLQKAPTIIRAMEEFQASAEATEVAGYQATQFARLMSDWASLRQYIEILLSSNDWSRIDAEKGAGLLNALSTTCQLLRDM